MGPLECSAPEAEFKGSCILQKREHCGEPTLNGEPTRRRPISLAELAGVPPRRRGTLAVDTNQWLREVTARAHLPAELLSALVQAYVVTVLREPQAKTP